MAKSRARYPMGWLGPAFAAREWEKESVRAHFTEFFIANQTRSTENIRACPWDGLIEKATGKKYLPNVAQETGDCVSFGMKNAVEHLSCIERAGKGERQIVKLCFCPYIYGSSRMAPEAGNGELSGRGAGSLGSWAAIVVQKYGILFSDTEDCPPYSGKVADRWGDTMDWKQFTPTADDFLVRGVAPIKNGDQLRDAIVNGYPCTIASNVGYSMRLKDDRGKSWYTGRDSWAHQQAFTGYDPQPVPCVYKLNSWGESAHGPQLDGPPGGGWVTLEEADRTIRQGDAECFAISNFDGFPEQEKLWDNTAPIF